MNEQNNEPTARSLSPAEKIAAALLPAAAQHCTAAAGDIWPGYLFAQELPAFITDPNYSDQDIIGAFKILRSFGFDQAVRRHGFQALWDADMENPEQCVAFGLYAFRRDRRALLDWMFQEGYLNLDDKLANNKSLAFDALNEDGEYLLYLARKGARLSDVAQELGSAGLYAKFSAKYRWSAGVEELCNRAFQEGLHPWEKAPDGSLPISHSLYEQDMAFWILGHAREGDLSSDLLRRLLRRCPQPACPELYRRLADLELAFRERRQLSEAAPSPGPKPAAAAPQDPCEQISKLAGHALAEQPKLADEPASDAKPSPDGFCAPSRPGRPCL